jgi:ankyrin repeat protein
LVVFWIAAALSYGGQNAVDARDRDGRTALMRAVLADDAARVRELLASRADPNLQDHEGDTALLLSEGRVPSIVRLLLAANADPNLANKEGRTPLIAAARNEADSVRVLLAAGADPAHRDDTGVAALTVARAAGRAEVEKLLRAVGARESPEEELHEAIRKGDAASVRRLILSGADVNALDNDRYETPLMAALASRSLDILLVLLEAGADPVVEADGWDNAGENAIVVAAREGSPWALRKLIEKHARPGDLDRALFAGCSHEGVVRVLIEAGARVNSRGERNQTPLICAARAGSTESVTLLLASGADARLVSDDGKTARAWAVASGKDATARRLREAELIPRKEDRR